VILFQDNSVLATNGWGNSSIPKPKKGYGVYSENKKDIQKLTELDGSGTDRQVKPGY